MPVEEIRNWARLRQDYLNWSYVDFSEASGVSVKTISASFSKSGGDVKYTTFAPMLCALVGGEPGETPCPVSPEDIAIKDQTIQHQAERISALEQENENLKNQLSQEEIIRRQDVDSTKAEKQRTIDALKQDLQFSHDQILHKDKQIHHKDAVIMSNETNNADHVKTIKRLYRVLIAVIVAFSLYLIIYDVPNPEYGLFHLKSLVEFIKNIFSPGFGVVAAAMPGIHWMI